MGAFSMSLLDEGACSMRALKTAQLSGGCAGRATRSRPISPRAMVAVARSPTFGWVYREDPERAAAVRRAVARVVDRFLFARATLSRTHIAMSNSIAARLPMMRFANNWSHQLLRACSDGKVASGMRRSHACWMRWVVLLLAMSSFARAAPTRAEFAAKLAQVKPGMTADRVKQILGAPDDIKTEADPGGISAARTVEIWRYGAAGHLKTATLGSVHIQGDRTVQYVFGGKGKPFTGIKEPELRRLLELIDAVPSYNETLQPLALVRAVNALHALGKDTALDVVDEYLRVSSWLDDGGREGVFLIMRTLFDVPPGGMPPMMVGAPSPAEPKDKNLVPRFPLVIVGDVPLKIVRGGKAESPEDDVAAFRRVGTLRAKPLVPSATALDEIDAAVSKLAKVIDLENAYVFDQALRFFGTVHRPSDATVDTWIPSVAKWPQLRADIAKLKPKWNATTQQMELPGGKTLPIVTKQFRRVWWDFKMKNTSSARVTFERLTDDLVSVEARFDASGVVGDTLRIVDVKTGKSLTDIALTAVAKSGVMTSQRLQIPLATQVRPELASGAKGTALTP
jgi:hypothetical protein